MLEVEECMRSLTERWLLVEELIKQCSSQQQEDERITKIKDDDDEMQSILSMQIDLSNQEQKNEHTLNFLKVDGNSIPGFLHFLMVLFP